MSAAGSEKPEYVVQRVVAPPSLKPDWDAAEWQGADGAEVSHFLRESSAHQPRTLAKLIYTDDGLHGIFRVEDRYVRSVRTKYFDEVWKDSAVEFFFKP